MTKKHPLFQQNMKHIKDKFMKTRIKVFQQKNYIKKNNFMKFNKKQTYKNKSLKNKLTRYNKVPKNIKDKSQ